MNTIRQIVIEDKVYIEVKLTKLVYLVDILDITEYTIQFKIEEEIKRISKEEFDIDYRIIEIVEDRNKIPGLFTDKEIIQSRLEQVINEMVRIYRLIGTIDDSNNYVDSVKLEDFKEDIDESI